MGAPAIFGPEFSSQAMRAEKRSVAMNSLIAALAITTLKIIVGLGTGSLGILSEAAHSGLDLIAAAVTLFSVRVSDKPADADHQYGHGKIENFSAFIETGLLLLTCAVIVYEACKRLFFHHVAIEPTLIAFSVMFVSMAVDFWRSRALGKIAAKYDSQALQADALHFSTDIWSSGVVALGLLLVLVGRRLQIPWLAEADPTAALFVAGVIILVSFARYRSCGCAQQDHQRTSRSRGPARSGSRAHSACRKSIFRRCFSWPRPQRNFSKIWAGSGRGHADSSPGSTQHRCCRPFDSAGPFG